MRDFHRGWSCAALLFVTIGLVQSAAAQTSPARIVDQRVAARHGLKRAWFTQLAIDPSRTRLLDLKLDRGTLFALSEQSIVQALDANTGRVLWTTEVGNPRLITYPPGVGEKHVAVINGTTVYVLDRATGALQWKHGTRGSPAAGPAINEEAVFCANMNGQLEVYSLVDSDHRGLANLRIDGRPLSQPVATRLGVFWGSSTGDIGLGKIDGTNLLFRKKTGYPMVASAAAFGDELYVANDGGYLYCFDNPHGEERWSFTTGVPIVRSPVPFANAVYVQCQDKSMFRVNPADGREVWRIGNIRHFLAASPTKLYLLDRFDRMAVVNPKNGATVDLIPVPPVAFTVANQESDLIVMATDSGLVQALHEIQLTERVVYAPPAQAPASPPTKLKGPVARPRPADAAPDGAANPQAEGAAPARPAVPAPRPAPQPAPLPADDEDPFKE